MTRTSNLIRSLLFVLATLIALVLIAFIVWRVNLAHEVNAKLAAIRAAGLPTNGKELNDYYPAVPDSENAALVMSQAFALMRNFPDDRSNEVDQIQYRPRGQLLTDRQKGLLAGYVEMNSNALAKVNEAVLLPKCRYPIAFAVGFDTPLPHLEKIQDLAFLFKNESMLADESSNPAAADASIISIVGMARTLEAEPVVLSQLVRFRLINIATATLESRLNAGKLTEGELTNFAATFVDRENINFVKRALIGERAAVIPMFSLSFRRFIQLASLDVPLDGPPASEHQSLFFRMTGYFQRELSFYLDVMATNISIADLSPPQNIEVAAKASETTFERAIHSSYRLSTVILPPVTALVRRETECSAFFRISAAAIAVERIRLAHGELPEKLDELVPEFLPAVPADPFDGRPLRYRRLAKGYVIYSVGDDGHDDGGREPPRDLKSNVKPGYDITFTVER